MGDNTPEKSGRKKCRLSSDILGRGAQAVPNTSWGIYFHLTDCRSNQPAEENIVNQMSEIRPLTHHRDSSPLTAHRLSSPI